MRNRNFLTKAPFASFATYFVQHFLRRMLCKKCHRCLWLPLCLMLIVLTFRTYLAYCAGFGVLMLVCLLFRQDVKFRRHSVKATINNNRCEIAHKTTFDAIIFALQSSSDVSPCDAALLVVAQMRDGSVSPEGKLSMIYYVYYSTCRFYSYQWSNFCNTSDDGTHSHSPEWVCFADGSNDVRKIDYDYIIGSPATRCQATPRHAMIQLRFFLLLLTPCLLANVRCHVCDVRAFS